MRVFVTWHACTRAARGLEVPFHTAVPRIYRALDRGGRADHALVVLARHCTVLMALLLTPPTTHSWPFHTAVPS